LYTEIYRVLEAVEPTGSMDLGVLIPIPANELRLPDESNRYYTVTLHSLIDRHRAHQTSIASRQQTLRANDLVATILDDDELLKHLPQNPYYTPVHNFGALVELTTFDYNNPEEHLYVKREPHIVLPTRETDIAAAWRERNTTYERQKVTFFGLRPINKETYEKGVHLK